MNKRYIGDGIYIREGDFPGFYVLTTENGISIQNTIYVEPQHIVDISEYITQSLKEHDGRSNE